MNEQKADILMIEDNLGVVKLNRIALERKGFSLRSATSLAEARIELHEKLPDLILLDIMLPDGDGMEFLQEIRSFTQAPVLMLTSKRDNADIVRGLMEGADDYLTKPYRIEELYARIIALLRRLSPHIPDLLHRGPITLDPISGHAYIADEDMLLSQKEFALLLVLVRNEGHAVSKEELYETVWNAPGEGDLRVVKTHISNVRKKLENSGYTIFSSRGEGYIFESTRL